MRTFGREGTVLVCALRCVDKEERSKFIVVQGILDDPSTSYAFESFMRAPWLLCRR